MVKKILMLLFVILVILGAPFALVALLDTGILTFQLGEDDTWIAFWGTYIGAIVSASVVYFVARFQIKKQYEQQMYLFQLQNEQQIKSIEMENKHSTKREMEKFHLINKLEKIEEMQALLEKISSINIDLNNDLVTFSVIKHAQVKSIEGNSSVDKEDQIYQLRTNYRKYHFEITKDIMRLIVLSNYVKPTEVKLLELQQKFMGLFQEVKDCYFSEELYKKYLIKRETSVYAMENSELIAQKIIEMNIYILQKELDNTLNKIEKYVE
ncbi:TVP38/TMEM64 family protein [Oceanobacillus profundus]|uniref:Uncharacterized protein n=1 Tax=Oceanobacillus profundus TaxID=372463 RepID=A0A417YK49_9BACI|nr:hypothetical protein [Oceanobacillus profundus]RHW33533.1 hypothetical protein D1B32_05685 [Oceanobacillus profundus]